MDPVTLGLLLNAGGLVASQLGGKGRPQYEIPQSARQALAKSRILAQDPSAPGESRRMDAARLSSANAIGAAQQAGNPLEAIASIQGQENRATQGILAESEMGQRQDQDQYMQMLLGIGEKEDLQFQMNEFAPYADKQNEMRDILGAATQNMYNLAEKDRIINALGGGSAPAIGGQPVPTQLTGNYDDQVMPTTMGMGTDTRGGGEWGANITDGDDTMALIKLLQGNLGKIKLF